MPLQNPNQWVRVKSGQHVGFRYEPGSALVASGVESAYYTLDGNWKRLSRDIVKVALGKFGEELEVSTKKPVEVT